MSTQPATHPLFDYGCGSRYHEATPLRQARARLDYWYDLKARLDRDCDGMRSRFCSNAADHYMDTHHGIAEAKAAIAAAEVQP